jgi:hypothetical protein
MLPPWPDLPPLPEGAGVLVEQAAPIVASAATHVSSKRPDLMYPSFAMEIRQLPVLISNRTYRI